MSWFAIRQYKEAHATTPAPSQTVHPRRVLARVTRGRAFRNDAIDHALGSQVVQLGAATYNSTPEPWLDIVTKGAICIHLPNAAEGKTIYVRIQGAELLTKHWWQHGDHLHQVDTCGLFLASMSSAITVDEIATSAICTPISNLSWWSPILPFKGVICSASSRSFAFGGQW